MEDALNWLIIIGAVVGVTVTCVVADWLINSRDPMDTLKPLSNSRKER